MVNITLENLSKSYGTTPAVSDVSLVVPSGSLFFLLGPSGCGKTTLLRMIAGFVPPTSGRILFDDQDMTSVPPHQRNTGMVFQSYALWPHMSVKDNVAFGLDARKMTGPRRAARMAWALDLVQMEKFADRKPNQLSGGQQQRVALARALAIEPRCLLLDEPLSNLDAKLRLEMRTQIKEIVKKARITTLYVTHDQKEALAMADGIALMCRGKIEQLGTPADLYRKPVSRFAADFLGESNFLDGIIFSTDKNHVVIDTPAGRIIAEFFSGSFIPGQKVIVAIRPEAVVVTREVTQQLNSFQGRCFQMTYLGDTAEIAVELPGGARIRALQLNPPATVEGLLNSPCTVSVPPESVMVMPWENVEV